MDDEKHDTTLLAILGKGMQIEEPIVGRRRIDLEVASVNEYAQRRVNRQGNAIHKTVGHLDRVDRERTDLERLAGADLIQFGIVEQRVLLELAFNVGEGEFGGVYRDV